jgi:hypothetical protein
MSGPVKESAGTSRVTTPTDREIRVERVFNAPREVGRRRREVRPAIAW